jgi:glycogen debranching enzyme
MTPAPGERLVRFVGDCIRYHVRLGSGPTHPAGWRALLRTNLGNGVLLRREIVDAHAKGAPIAGASWRDLPMLPNEQGWFIELPLAEAGFFQAKAYLIDARGWQHWTEGGNHGMAVHPDWTRTANTIYCAFTRLFGKTKSAEHTEDAAKEAQLKKLEAEGYAVIPPSGKLRDVAAQLRFITGELGCRILHLLPVNPTPTTYARFGRYGSPYACLDLTAIDPALVEFDKRTTGVEQFRELAFETHRHGARLFLDIVINHTGWGSTLQENCPQWFLRKPGGEFHSPGAWGTTWEDLVELKQDSVELWDAIADSLLTWSRRGVDGFRCDAGYMVPAVAWQYIIARVQQEFPDAVFLLEGLGGAWEATETLLTEGGMAWAYSELFQNYSGVQVSGYLDHAHRQSARVGTLVHYAETHDNDRLAARGRTWSLLRNRLCALASQCGGFGFTGGVEWLAAEKIRVHGCTGLNWGAKENIVRELARLNRLISDHPCFFDGAKLSRNSPPDSDVYALLRESAEGKDAVLVLANLNAEHETRLTLTAASLEPLRTGGAKPGAFHWKDLRDLLEQAGPGISESKGQVTFKLAPGMVHCLSAPAQPQGLSGEAYRAARSRAAWAIQALKEVAPTGEREQIDWWKLAEEVDRSPCDFLVSLSHPGEPQKGAAFPNVIFWTREDGRRVTMVPPGHWLLIEDDSPFRAALTLQRPSGQEDTLRRIASIAAGGKHIACFAPEVEASDGKLTLERFAGEDRDVSAEVRFLPSGANATEPQAGQGEDVVLLTNGRGGMARLCVDLGQIQSKYDCVLGANLHPTLPVDRHVLAKRLRVWVNADGFITSLDFQNLARFSSGPPARWHFIAQAGDGRTVELQLTADMVPGSNTTLFRFSRTSTGAVQCKQLPPEADVRLTVRVGIEDRNFHSETKRNGGAEHHFESHTQPLKSPAGFAFTPANDRHLRVFTSAGEYHAAPEWSVNIPHPIEATRGQEGAGDAYSPGWFDLPMPLGGSTHLIVTAEAKDPGEVELAEFDQRAHGGESDGPEPMMEDGLGRAARAYVVRRGEGKTVIAGYPWFLDWGRDTLICARGLLAAGLVDEVREILLTFARFEENGTLPNIIHGEHVGNRDTSDAPLWFGIVCEELAGHEATPPEKSGPSKSRSTSGKGGFYAMPVDESGRCIADILRSIAGGYLKGTANGIRVDPASGLVFSPSHFTWMDTNYPAGTPREGYPIEIQCMWIRLLSQLDRIGAKPVDEAWSKIADRAQASLERHFWLEEQGWYADVLRAGPGTPAARAQVDDALRSNCLFAVSLGLVTGERARRTVEASRRWLVVPGGLRSLAPLPVKLPLDIRHHGHLLNDPSRPYWGRYEGDEDTRRKPAYHNGTAWTWTFPVFCEALAAAWDHSPEAVAAAQAYLTSSGRLMEHGCIGQIPEILDGDAPHTQRGCDAQAWGVTEALRVWVRLKG